MSNSGTSVKRCEVYFFTPGGEHLGTHSIHFRGGFVGDKPPVKCLEDSIKSSMGSNVVCKYSGSIAFCPSPCHKDGRPIMLKMGATAVMDYSSDRTAINAIGSNRVNCEIRPGDTITKALNRGLHERGCK